MIGNRHDRAEGDPDGLERSHEPRRPRKRREQAQASATKRRERAKLAVNPYGERRGVHRDHAKLAQREPRVAHEDRRRARPPLPPTAHSRRRRGARAREARAVS